MQINVRKLVREIVITGLMVVVTMTGYGLYLQKDMPTGPAPELKAVQVNGEMVDLQALSQEEPVLVYFWASWCSVCSWVSPSVDKLANDYPVVSVALASGNDQKISHYLQAKELRFPVINDDEGMISGHWGVSVTPSLFIVSEGEIKHISTGFTTRLGMLLRLWLYK